MRSNVNGYRSIAVKCGISGRFCSRNEKVLNMSFRRVVDVLASPGSDSLSIGNWLLSIRKGGLPFSFCRIVNGERSRSISTPSTC